MILDLHYFLIHSFILTVFITLCLIGIVEWFPKINNPYLEGFTAFWCFYLSVSLSLYGADYITFFLFN